MMITNCCGIYVDFMMAIYFFVNNNNNNYKTTGENVQALTNSLNSRLGLPENGLSTLLKLNFCERMSKIVGINTVLMSSDNAKTRSKSIHTLLMKRPSEKSERKY